MKSAAWASCGNINSNKAIAKLRTENKFSRFTCKLPARSDPEGKIFTWEELEYFERAFSALAIMHVANRRRFWSHALNRR
jgi:hypothetical protein